jgi:hypothetical protein
MTGLYGLRMTALEKVRGAMTSLIHPMPQVVQGTPRIADVIGATATVEIGNGAVAASLSKIILQVRISPVVLTFSIVEPVPDLQ